MNRRSFFALLAAVMALPQAKTPSGLWIDGFARPFQRDVNGPLHINCALTELSIAYSKPCVAAECNKRT